MKFRIPLIDRYILGQYFQTFLFILGMVITLSVVVDVVEKLDEFLDKKPTLYETIFVYYLNFIPFWGSTLSPICIFLAVIFFTSRMAQRSEIIPMLSGGISFYRVFRPYFIASLILAGISFYLKAELVPRSTAKSVAFEYKYDMRENKFKKNQHIHKKVAEDTYIYISYYNEKRMEGHTFSLERVKDGDIVTKIQAKKIVWIDSVDTWRLEKIRLRNFNGEKEQIHFMDEKDTTFLLTPDDIFIREQKAQSMTLPELKEYIRLEEMRGSDILQELYTEKHRRYADPIAMIILTIIGFAMASQKSRGGTALKIGIGLLLCFLYVGLLFAGQAIIGDRYSPAVAVWLPNIVFSIVSIVLLWIAPK